MLVAIRRLVVGVCCSCAPQCALVSPCWRSLRFPCVKPIGDQEEGLLRDQHGHPRKLVSRTEIANLAEVRPSAVTNWEKRYRDFPKAVRSEGVEYFAWEEVLAWLDSRPVPRRVRREGEGDGASYGQRARANLITDSSRPEDDHSAAEVGATTPVEADDERTSAAVAALVKGPLAPQWGSLLGFLNLLLCLMFQRWVQPARWTALKRHLGSGSAGSNRAAVLDRIGRDIDETLRDHGVVPGMRSALNRLRPSADTAFHKVVMAVEGLGRSAFSLLLDEYSAVTGLDSRESVTPPDLAQLMAELALVGDGVPHRIYDPYPRGGELLTACAELVERQSDSAPFLVLQAGASRGDMQPLAVMNMLLYDTSPEVEMAGGAAPWRLPDQPVADCVLVNPPFNNAADPERRTRWNCGDPPPSNDNLGWVQYPVDRLSEHGRAIVLMANNAAVSGNKKEAEIRRAMVDAGVVRCVIALPPRLFRNTPIAVTIWILGPRSAADPGVLFIDARQAGTMTSRKQRRLTSMDRSAIVAAYQRPSPGHVPADRPVFSRIVDRSEIAAPGYSLSPSDYVVPELPPAATDVVAELRTHLADVARHTARVDERAGRLAGSAEWLGGIVGEWERRPLRELCEIQAGPSASRIPKDERVSEEGVPVVQPRQLRDRRVLPDVDVRIPSDVARRLRRFELAADDIVCVRTGTVGPVARVDGTQVGWIVGSNLLRLRRIVDIDMGYLLVYLSMPATVSWIKRRAESTAIKSISSQSLGELSVALPPLADQQMIGDVLGALDQQIVAHLTVAAAAESFYRALSGWLLPPNS